MAWPSAGCWPSCRARSYSSRPSSRTRPPARVTDRNAQRRFREELAATHAEAAQLLGDDAFELWPVFGEPVPTGIQALAADRGAGLIVFGSPQHGPIGRVLLEPIMIRLARFSLMIVGRFGKKELALSESPRSSWLSAAAAVAATGRTVPFSGTAEIVALILATAIVPTPILASIGIGCASRRVP